MKYLRAEYPDQLWQVDIKDPFTIEGQRMLTLVIINDNSGYLISCTLHTSITVDDVIVTFNSVVQKGHKPCKVLADLGPQF